MTSSPLCAGDVATGDLVIIDRRRYNVIAVVPVAFYSRNRLKTLAEAARHGVTLTLRPARAAGGRTTTRTFRNLELVRVVVQPEPEPEPMFETIAEFAFAVETIAEFAFAVEAAAGPALGRLFA